MKLFLMALVGIGSLLVSLNVFAVDEVVITAQKAPAAPPDSTWTDIQRQIDAAAQRAAAEGAARAQREAEASPPPPPVVQPKKCASIADGKKYLCDSATLTYKKSEYLKCGKLFFNDNLLSQCNLLVDTEVEAKNLTCNFNHETAIAKCD